MSTEPFGRLSSRLGRGAAPSCQVPARQQGRGHGGQREQLLFISDSALQRAMCGCPLFLHFSLPSLILISAKEQVNHRTQEAQFFLFSGDNQRPPSQRFLPIKGRVSTQTTWLPFFGLLCPVGPAAHREVRGLPWPPPAPWGTEWAPFLAVSPRRRLQQCIIGTFPLQVHDDQVLSRPLHPHLLSDLQAGGAGEAPAFLASRQPPPMLRIESGSCSVACPCL